MSRGLLTIKYKSVIAWYFGQLMALEALKRLLTMGGSKFHSYTQLLPRWLFLYKTEVT